MSNQYHPLQKKAMVEAMEKSLGVVTTAAKLVGISRQTHYDWMRDDPDYKTAIEELGEVALDYAESQLHKQIGNGEVASTIFYLKTRGKKRGYVERQEITGADGRSVITETHVKIIRDKATGITPGEFTPQSAGGTESEEKV